MKTTLQQIKDEVAKEYGYTNWNQLCLTYDDDDNEERVIDEVAKRYAAEAVRGLAKCITRVVTPEGKHREWLVDTEKCDKFLKDNNLINELK